MIFTIKDGISYELNKNNFTAQVISSSNAKGSIIIPRSINYQSNEYLILKIKESSFQLNLNIKSIDFPEDSALVSIEKNAFSKSSLKEISIPSSVEELQEGWCKHTSSLTTISLSPKNNFFKLIDEKLLIGKSDKNSEKFDSLIFGCRNIQKVTIPSYIKRIESFSFSECKNLSDISFSYNSDLLFIGRDAFSYTSIESLTIPSKVEELSDGWCRKTSKLKHVSISSENKNFSIIDDKFIVGKSNKNNDKFDALLFANRDIDKAEIPSFIKKICPFAFSECIKISTIELSENSELNSIERNAFCYSSIQSLFIPPKVEVLKDGWCKNIYKLNHVSVSLKNENFSCINNEFIVGKSDRNISEFNEIIFGFRNVERVKIPKYIQKICQHSFSNCFSLHSVEFENDSQLQSFGKNCFSKSSIENLIIPSHVKNIGARSFYKCEKLKSIQFAEDSELEIIGRKSFLLTAIERISIPSKVQEIGERCFQECESLKNIIFSEESELKSIEKYTFSFSWIENINIPNKVTRISERAFSYCKNLKKIKFTDQSKLQIIEKNSFFNSNIEEINFPTNLKDLQEGWCSYTNRLTHISISNNNPNYKYLDNKIIIGKNQESDSEYTNLLFARRDIKEITIPNYIKRIEAFAFYECRKLKHIIIEPESTLEYIGQESFSCTSIENLIIPSNVTEIGERAFYWCRQLKTITFSPETKLRRFNKEIFYYSSIEQLYIPTSIEEMKPGWCDFTWKLKYISISPNNKHFKYIDNKIIVGKTDEKSDVYDVLVFARRDIDSITIPSYITKIDAFAFSWCVYLKSIFFSEYSKLSLIESTAFSFTSFRKIVIPPHVKKIGFRAFYRCENLRIVEFSEDSELTSIEKEAFAYTPIESLFIPSKVKEIKEGWCKHTSKLTNITISKENEYFTYYDNKIIIDNDQQSIIFCRRDVKEINIPKHIKTIKSYSFCECYELKTISIPEESSLSTIEEGSFINTSIEEIYFPSQLEEVQEGWCKHTNKLQHIKISPNNKYFKYNNNQYLLKRTMNSSNNNDKDNEEEYDQLIFVNRNINEITIPKHIKRIGEYSFQYCQNLYTIKFEENSKLRFIEKNSFAKSSLKSIIIPRMVKKIEDRSFFKCFDLKSIEFSENSELLLIDQRAFSLTPIERISIPSKVQIIGERAFYSCTHLESVLFSEDSELVNIEKNAFSLSSIKNIFIPSKVNQIGEQAFYECRNLSSVDFNEDSQLHLICEKAFSKTSIEILNIPSQVEVVKDSWCKNIMSLNEFNVSPNNKYFTCLNKKLLVKKSDKIYDDYDTLVFVLNDVETVEIPSSIKTICSYAFYRCQKLKNIIFSEDTKLYEIDRKAFSKTSIQSISIPSKVKYIHESAFNSCINLASCDFAKNSELSSIDSFVFYETALEEIKIPSNVTIINSKAFQYCSELKSIEFTEDSKLLTIEKDAFYNLANLEKINLPSSLKELKEGWLNGIKNLKYVSIANNNKRYKYILDKFIIGKNQEEDSEYTNLLFARRDIEEATIPNYIKRIEAFAFYECRKLKHIIIEPESTLEYIGQESFSCTSIENLIIPSDVTEIGERAFYWCRQLKTITFSPETKLRRFNKEIFYYSSIEQLYIPTSIEEMKPGWCDFSIELNDISISPENTSFLCIDDKLIIGKSNESSNEYDVLVFASRDIENAFIPSFIKHIEKYAFSWCRNLESITFANNSNLQSIDEEAFCYSSLQSIDIPPDVDFIGEQAFYNCTNLQSINFSESSKLKKIGKNYFSKSIESIFIPASIEQMDEGWCSELQKLVNVSISSENKNFSLFDNKFILGKSDKSSDEFDVLIFARRDIEKAVIPSSVKQMGPFSFSNCDSLKSIEFSENSQINSIEKSAFQNSSLKSISFPSSLKELKENWCQNANKLTNIKISPENEVFSLIDDQIIVGKSKNSDEYEDLLFANRYIERAYIPSTIKYIHSFAFQKCTFLKYVDFGRNSNLKEINQNAFNNSSLRSISIPNHVKIIEKCAFSFCLNLCAVEFLGDNVLIDNDIFMESKSIFLFSCPNAKKVIIEQYTFNEFSSDLIILAASGSLVI